MKKLSIITPSLNQSQFIEQTIRSVLDQAGDFEIEYIIADGGSSDGSVEIIEKYEKLLENNQYPVKCKGINLKWWSRKDGGQASAINEGLKNSKGDILTWLNSDDYFEPDALAFVSDELNSSEELDFIYGNANLVDKKSILIKQDKLKYFDYDKLLREGNLIHQPASFFSKKFFEKFGPLDDDLYYTFDYDLILKSLKESKYKYADKTLANFRIWDQSKTYNKPMKMMNEMEKVRRCHSGKFFDPSNLHRLRHKIPGNQFMKRKFPKFFKTVKKLLYRIA